MTPEAFHIICMQILHLHIILSLVLDSFLYHLSPLILPANFCFLPRLIMKRITVIVTINKIIAETYMDHLSSACPCHSWAHLWSNLFLTKVPQGSYYFSILQVKMLTFYKIKLFEQILKKKLPTSKLGTPVMSSHNFYYFPEKLFLLWVNCSWPSETCSPEAMNPATTGHVSVVPCYSGQCLAWWFLAHSMFMVTTPIRRSVYAHHTVTWKGLLAQWNR